MVSISDDVAIVTGGSTRSGREVARALAARGYEVVLVYLDDQIGADGAIETILAADGTALAVRADITDDLDVERLFAETVAAFGGVDVIVHSDFGSRALINQQAARHLRDGGAMVFMGESGPVDPVLIRELRGRGCTISTCANGIDGPAAPDHATATADIEHCLAILDGWRSDR